MDTGGSHTTQSNATNTPTGKSVCGLCGAEFDKPLRYCGSCGNFDSILPSWSRPADRLWNSPKLVPASKLIQTRKISKLEPYGIPYSSPCLVVVTGPPGSMKSTMATRIADAFPLPVLYDSLEEGTSDTLRLRLKRLEILRDDLWFTSCSTFNQIEEGLDETGAGLYVLDSITVSNLLPRDLLRLAREKRVVVIAVNQITKDGKGAGPQELQHESDILIDLDAGKWRLSKSRFGELIGGEVL